MKTVRSFANEEEEAEVYSRKLQQVYKLNRKEAAAYTYYVWGSGVCGAGPTVGGGGGWDTKMGRSLRQGASLGPCVSVSGWLPLASLCPTFLSAGPWGRSFRKRMQPPSRCLHRASPHSLSPGHGLARAHPRPGRESPRGHWDPTEAAVWQVLGHNPTAPHWSVWPTLGVSHGPSLEDGELLEPVAVRWPHLGGRWAQRG